MNRIQVEARVIELVARALRGEGVEDSQVELKSDWPDDIPKTARLIAAHLNASHGEPILWIFGVNEKEAKLVPRTQVELANWWPQIQKNYDQLPPSLVMDMEVAVEGGSVSAIVISSEEAPFVIKSPASGIIQREVPWREGRNTRSARRFESPGVVGIGSTVR